MNIGVSATQTPVIKWITVHRLWFRTMEPRHVRPVPILSTDAARRRSQAGVHHCIQSRGQSHRTITFTSRVRSRPTRSIGRWPIIVTEEYLHRLYPYRVDIDAPYGAPILAAGPGTIIWANWGLLTEAPGNHDDPYGQAVVIRMDFGFEDQQLYTVYAHMSNHRHRRPACKKPAM